MPTRPSSKGRGGRGASAGDPDRAPATSHKGYSVNFPNGQYLRCFRGAGSAPSARNIKGTPRGAGGVQMSPGISELVRRGGVPEPGPSHPCSDPFLQNFPQLTQHLTPTVRGIVLPQFWAGFVFAELIDPIPQQFGAAASVLGEFLEVRIEEPEGRNRLTLPSEEVAMHQVVMLVTWENAQLDVRVQRRDTCHDRQVVVDIGAPIFPDG